MKLAIVASVRDDLRPATQLVLQVPEMDRMTNRPGLTPQRHREEVYVGWLCRNR